MTRTERVLARRWRLLVLVCVLVALAGAVVIVWSRVDAARVEAAALAREADQRGAAVSTLAGDVRTLRAQLEAGGESPRAPDPADAIDDLPERAEVPVPIPGRPGEKGDPGRPAPTITPENGRDGAPGEPGADSTVPGPSGQPGAPGKDGADGQDGQDGADGARGPAGPPGPHCPEGYSLQEPSWDRDALVCRRDGAPPPDEPGPSPSPDGGLLSLAALDPTRRTYP